MQAAQPQPQPLEPVWAVVLVRDSIDAQEARVLLAGREYWTFMRDDQTHHPIMKVSHLADAAAARARQAWTRLVIEGPPRVFNFNPTDKELADLSEETEVTLPADLMRVRLATAEDIADDHRGQCGIRNPYFVIVTQLPNAPQRVRYEQLLPVQELFNFLLALRPADGCTFAGLEHDMDAQRRMLGRFAPDEPVIPFIHQRYGRPIFDSRFAPFIHTAGPSRISGFTHESQFLATMGDIAMIETAATGKSRAILDTGRQHFMIYVKCDAPSEVSTSASPQEITVTGDLLFLDMIAQIKANCSSERTNDAFIEKAQGYILADICARLCFMRWILQYFPETTPEQFLVAQLSDGREVMRFFFRHLIRYPAATLQQLATLFAMPPLPGCVDAPRWAVDEAQVAVAFFKDDKGPHFESGDKTEARSLLSEYIRWLKREDIVAARQVIVAGTGLTTFGTKEQLHSQIAKFGGDQRLQFPVLHKSDVMQRLGRVLNLDEVDWAAIPELSLVTGRCRWSAHLVDLISELESDLQRQFSEHKLAELPFKVKVINQAIDTFRARVTRKIVEGITQRLRSKKIDEHHRQQDEDLIRRMYVICTLYHSQANGVRMFFTGWEVNTLLALGLGQFAGADVRADNKDVPVYFDRMTTEALTECAKQFGWTVPDLVATWLEAQRDTITPQEAGVKFQLMVAAALYGLPSNMTVATFANMLRLATV